MDDGAVSRSSSMDGVLRRKNPQARTVQEKDTAEAGLLLLGALVVQDHVRGAGPVVALERLVQHLGLGLLLVLLLVVVLVSAFI